MFESLFNKVAGRYPSHFIKKETPTQVFSREICEIFKNTYFEKHLRTAAFAIIHERVNFTKNFVAVGDPP